MLRALDHLECVSGRKAELSVVWHRLYGHFISRRPSPQQVHVKRPSGEAPRWGGTLDLCADQLPLFVGISAFLWLLAHILSW